MQKINCRLCGADDTELLWLGHDLALQGREEFPVVRCNQCGLIYLRVRPSPAEMGRYYPPEYHHYYRSAINDEPFFLMRWIRQRKFLKRRRILEEFSPHVPGRILDVGCSTGNFLYSMQEFGWEALGVETSAYAVRLARQQLGLEVFHGRLEDTHSPSGHFDVVTLWDVLEHTFDPVRTLQEVNRLLVEDGVVGLTVPNWDSLDRHLFGHAWIGYDPPRHLYVFPHSVMERMLEESGFRILRMWCGFGGYYTFVASLRLWLNEHLQTSWLRNALIKALYIPGTRFPFEPFFVLSDSLGFGGTLVVLAQKIGAASNEGT